MVEKQPHQSTVGYFLQVHQIIRRILRRLVLTRAVQPLYGACFQDHENTMWVLAFRRLHTRGSHFSAKKNLVLFFCCTLSWYPLMPDPEVAAQKL